MSVARRLRHTAIVALVATAYFVAGKIGLRLAFLNPSATAFWPPTGIALAAILIFGFRVWPGVWVGAFLVNLTTAGTLLTSVGIATGNTLEAVLGVALVRHFATSRRVLDQASDIFRFAGLAGLLSTLVSATIGTGTLALAGLAPASGVRTIWLTWWLGDVSGALVVAPFLVLWSRLPRFDWTARRGAEAAVLLGTLVTLALWVFRHQDPHYPLQFLCLPVLLWSAFRFTQRETSSAMMALSAIAISSTRQGMGPFADYGVNTSLLLLQAYLTVTSTTVLAVSATVTDRRRHLASIRQLNEALERRVIERTERLAEANQELRHLVRERAVAAEELRRSEARLQDAQQVARMGSWEWNVPRDALWWSDALYSIYGLEPRHFEVTYASYLERVHPDDRERVRLTLEEALRERRSFEMEHRIVRPDGEVLVLHGRGHVTLDTQGRPIGMMGTAQDITERRRAEDARATLAREQAARREAEEANRLKDEFLATLSHELRNPLNAIVGWARLLRDGRLDAPTAARAIEAINRSADLQSQLILDLLDLSRITSGRVELDRRPVDATVLIDQVAESLRPTARGRRVTLARHVGTPGRPVLGDPERLQQVMWNLLANAIRFAREGGVVTIRSEFDELRARIRVEDDGPGIEPELLPRRIFDPFRQGTSKRARRHDGLGLGLAIARHLVELHGGSIEADNVSPGPGAAFTIELPLATVPEIGSPATAARDGDGAAGAARTGSRTLSGMRVLVVEDVADSRDLLRTLLAARGAEVVVAESCAQALARFHGSPPDVLISDIEMPGGSGYELIAHIRALPPERGGSVPAIALTAYAGADHARQALESGYQAHIAKPFESGDLIAILEELADERA